MVMDICLVIITVAIVAVAAFCIRTFFQVQKLIQIEMHTFFLETNRLLYSLNEFIQRDLNTISRETSLLINKLNDLSSDINNKSHSLNFLFKPLGFLNSKLNSDSSEEGSASIRESLPQILKWIASGAMLLKATKEFMHEKSNSK